MNEPSSSCCPLELQTHGGILSRFRHPALLALPILGGLLATMATAPAQAETASSGAAAKPASTSAAAARPSQCPDPLPTSSVRRGIMGKGLTVTAGHKPRPFRVKVLGVLPNGLAPGKDLILIKASDFRGHRVIRQGGGIWAGLSGSPVHVGNKLLGAVSYGFTWAPSPIGGVTPAEDMYDVFDYGKGGRTARAAGAKSVAIPRSMQGRIAAAGAPRGANELERLPIPFSVRGLSSQRLAQLKEHTRRAGLPVVSATSAGRRAPSAAGKYVRPKAGGNFVGALSYGDVTLAGTGTTTAVCGKRALAFGHPFLFAGPVGFGANNGKALAIVKDETLGSFKMACIAGRSAR